MPIEVASAHLQDDEFLAAFASCKLPPEFFRHGDHLRLAWLMLSRHTLADAIARVRCGIQRFAAHQGARQRYHETITAAWVKLLATHTEPDFAAFLRENECRLSVDLLHRFWSPQPLATETARCEWLAPDLCPLPDPVSPRNSRKEGLLPL